MERSWVLQSMIPGLVATIASNPSIRGSGFHQAVAASIGRWRHGRPPDSRRVIAVADGAQVPGWRLKSAAAMNRWFRVLIES